MSEMLERVAKAIELAQGNAPFYVMPCYKDKARVYEMLGPGMNDLCVREICSFEEAKDWCEKLNNLWVAKKAIEALKPMADDVQNKYFQMALKSGYTHMSACFPNANWERAIDAILCDK